MTPKEKAKEIYNKMLNNIDGYNVELEISAKECALIAVDEIISYLLKIKDEHGFLIISKNKIAYWQEVKQEIEKL